MVMWLYGWEPLTLGHCTGPRVLRNLTLWVEALYSKSPPYHI